MGNATIVHAGNDKQAEFLAFGDDSQFENGLAYAFVVVRRSRLQYAEERLRGLKRLYRIPPDVPVHCRVLFNKHAREKSGLGHLTNGDAREIIRRGIALINRVPMLLRYAFDTVDRFRASIGATIDMTHETDGTKLTLPVNYDPKGVLGILMQASFMVPPDGCRGPTASQCEIHVSEDATKVGFIGKRRQRADRMYNGYSDIGAPIGEVYQLQPKIVTPNESPLLQLADIAAYVCSHALGTVDDTDFFRDQLRQVEFWGSAGWGTHPRR